MAPVEVHELDSDSDVILQLFRPVKQEGAPTKDDESRVTLSGSVASEATVFEPGTGTQITNSTPDDTSAAANPEEGEKACPDGKETLEEVHFKVSSTHMTSASRTFKTLLHGSMREAIELRENGNTTVPLPDDDPAAFLVLLNIIHLNNRLVPRRVDFDKLLQLALLVDKYEMHDATRTYAWIWLNGLKSQPPQTFQPNVVSWIFISWVFEDTAIFSQVTASELNSYDDELDFGALPVPENVVDCFRQRHLAQTTAITIYLISICDLRANLLEGRVKCGHYCDSYVLGLVVRLSRELGIADDCADLPSSGKKYNQVTNQITKTLISPFEKMISDSSQVIRDRTGWRLCSSRADCPNLKLVKNVTEKYGVPIAAGLNLQHFLNKATDVRRGRKKTRVS